MKEGISAKKAEALFMADAVFVRGAEKPEGLVSSHFPEVAFIGRSNVGKSSLINALTDKKIARTSNTPGRTQQILFFRLGDRIMLVDMPGYGFAKAPPAQVREWHDLIDFYLKDREQLRRLCVLIDSRHGIKDNDDDFMKMLSIYVVPFVVVLTKTDKIHPKELAKTMEATKAAVQKYGCGWPDVFAVSSEKELGLEELRLFLAESLLKAH